MDRKKFVRTLGFCVVGIPLVSQVLQSCTSIYYANTSEEAGKITVLKSEFIDEKDKQRQFVLVTPKGTDFPISLYKIGADDYVASLLKCIHRGCELNVGGIFILAHATAVSLRQQERFSKAQQNNN